MLLRDERPDDVSRIRHIQFAAFTDHPMHPPGSAPVEHRIVERLRQAGALTLSLLAEVDGVAVGHVALSPAPVGQARAGWFLLGPVGVLPENQGRGIGSALIREALARLHARGALGVVLVGDPGFYARFGFASLPGLAYPGVPDPYVLAVRLGQATPRGDIEAHDAFAIPFEARDGLDRA